MNKRESAYILFPTFDLCLRKEFNLKIGRKMWCMKYAVNLSFPGRDVTIPRIVTERYDTNPIVYASWIGYKSW